MFYSKTTGGFYAEEIHGLRTRPDGSANPDCLIPLDAVEVTDEQRAALLAAQAAGKIIEADANGYPIAVDSPAPSQANLIKQLEADVQMYVDSKAQAKGYDSAASCISYLTSSNAGWAADAKAMRDWRDAVWSFCYSESQNIGNTIPVPTKEQLLAALPAAPW